MEDARKVKLLEVVWPRQLEIRLWMPFIRVTVFSHNLPSDSTAGDSFIH